MILVQSKNNIHRRAYTTAQALACLVALAAGNPAAGAQQAAGPVASWTGTVEMTPVASAPESVIVFRSPYALAGGTNTLVVVVQLAEGEREQKSWSGPARLFLGEGVAGVLGEGIRRLYKFPEKALNPSLVGLKFEVISAIGMAQYGETRALGEEEIGALKAFGSACRLSGQKGNEPRSAAEICTNCTSGGEGATQCSSGGGGCSVSCTTGYWACCSANTGNCRCCKSN